MKIKLYLGLVLCVLLSMPACNYLDIVPDERPTEEDAFIDKDAAERYLYSCYAFMPEERLSIYLQMSGEVVGGDEKNFLQGTYTAAAPGDFQFWAWLYGGIRRCYSLIENVDNVPHLDESTKKEYKAEAKFLIAYFNFYLLKAYGPFIISDKVYDIDMPASDYQKRAPFDECVTWIVNMLDDAKTDLKEDQETTYYGRATKLVAESLKSRVLLYAASPLFNGNSDFYSNTLLDPDTSEPLMSVKYDPQKWEKALTAAEAAIAHAESSGFKLYQGEPSEDEPYPADPTEYSLRMTFIDRKNKEVIWADGRLESYYGLQNCQTPRDPEREDPSWNGGGPSLEVVENFYTENGLPIKEDPKYYPESDWFKVDKYDGENTCRLHLKREPRFYAWISFHNGWYELQRNGEARIRTLFRNEDPQGSGTRTRNFTYTGYLIKKAVGLSFDTRNGFPNYSWPLIRLAELYLNAAEAAVEVNKLDVAKKYLNKVRERAGIPTVEKSWAGIATLDQKKLREIVRKEREIELFYEGHYGWDKRRWLEADEALNHNPHGLNIAGVTDEEFFRPVEVQMLRKFVTPTHYLLPIRSTDIDINQKLVQNPGY